MSFEEPTQRLSVRRDPAETTAAQTTAAQTTVSLPRPLDLAGPTPPSTEPADKTDELSLDEIFAASQSQTVEPQADAAPRVEEAPTWTAMPVIPVRSEPVPSQPSQPPPSAPTHVKNAQSKPKRTGPSTGERLLADASAALDGALRRSQAWLTHQDNGLMVMTAAVAIILILVVAAVGS
jgi:hypothetical protein